MNKKSALELQAEKNIEEQTRKSVKDLDRDQIIDLLVEANKIALLNKEKNNLLRNALFVSSSENMQPTIYDCMEKDADDPDVSAQIQEFREEQLAMTQITKEEFEKQISRLAEKEKKLQTAVKEKNKKSKEPKAPKPRKVDEVRVVKLEDNHCPVCGKELVSAGYTTKTEVEYIPAQFKVVEYRYETAVCPDKCTDENGNAVIKSARPSRPNFLGKSLATPSLVAGIATLKFVMGLPVYRIEKLCSSASSQLTRQTLITALEPAFYEYLAPLCEQIRLDLLKMNVVHMDETPLQCLEFKDRVKSYMICGTSGRHEKHQMTVYSFSEDRKADFITDFLGTDFIKALMTDGLQSYSNYEGCIKLACMAHARREFYDAMTCRDDYAEFKKILNSKAPDLEDKTVAFLQKHEALNTLIDAVYLISQLYLVESHFASDPVEVIYAARQKISRPVFEQLVKKAEEIQSGFEEKTKANKAANYFLNRKEELERYMEDGSFPIDNNKAECEIRPFVIARKNFLFTNTIEGAETAAGYMTLTRSAVLNGLDPFKYLTYVLEELRKYQGMAVPDDVLRRLVPYSNDLPDDLKADKAEEAL